MGDGLGKIMTKRRALISFTASRNSTDWSFVMTLRAFALSWVIVLGILTSIGTAAGSQRPNIILIVADDYGIPGVGCYGGQYATPHLDALAASGLRFQYCFSMPLCGPSRAVLLSGRYPFRNGVTDNDRGGEYRPSDSPSIAKLLRQAGYK